MLPWFSNGPVCPEPRGLTCAITHVQHRHVICHTPRSRVVFLGLVTSSPHEGSPLTQRTSNAQQPLMLASRIACAVGPLIQSQVFAAYIATMRLSSTQCPYKYLYAMASPLKARDPPSPRGWEQFTFGPAKELSR